MPSPPSAAAGFGTANGSGAFASLYAAVAELQEMSGRCEECNADGLPFFLNHQANARNSCVRCLLKTCETVGAFWRENNRLRSMNEGLRKQLPMLQGYGDGATWSSAPPQFQFGASSSSSARENNQLRSMNDVLRKQLPMLQGYGDGATWSSAPPQFQFGASSSSSAQIHGTQVHGGQDPDYKTKICEQWALGTCIYGLQCKFAHGNEELRPAIRYCWRFLREGVCKFGESCPYLHAKPPSEFLEYE